MTANALADLGFAIVATGGNCQAFYRMTDGQSEVITSHDGDLPSDDEWLWVKYDGDFLSDPDVLILDSADSDQSPVGLIELLAA